MHTVLWAWSCNKHAVSHSERSKPMSTNRGNGGTAEDPCLLFTAKQMYAVGLDHEDWDEHFKLTADIDLSAYKGNT